MYNHGGRDVGGANALGASVEVASCERRTGGVGAFGSRWRGARIDNVLLGVPGQTMRDVQRRVALIEQKLGLVG